MEEGPDDVQNVDPRLKSGANLRAKSGAIVQCQSSVLSLKTWTTQAAHSHDLRWKAFFQETKNALVTAGPVISDPARSAEISNDELVSGHQIFTEETTLRKKYPIFFCIETPLPPALGLRHTPIGKQPWWHPEGWPEILGKHKSLREQLRRAKAKGVEIQLLPPSPWPQPMQKAVEDLIVGWQSHKGMAPMSFLVDVSPEAIYESEVVFAAQRKDSLVGLLAVSLYKERNEAFFEHLIRGRHAPNGTSELLFDAAMSWAADKEIAEVTTGLAPLAGKNPRPVALIKKLARPFFDFSGLERFKAKLRPERWQTVYMAAPETKSLARTYLEVLRAFADGSLSRFAFRTALQKARAVVMVLGLLLIPWTLLLAVAPTIRWFPSQPVKLAWIGYDIVLFCGLLSLSKYPRRWLYALLGAAALLDFSLGTVQAVFFNFKGRSLQNLPPTMEIFFVTLSLGAPAFAAVFLFSAASKLKRRSLRPLRPG